jgi:hypothetical protein
MVSQNGGDGVFAGGGSTVAHNTAYGNGDDGFEVGQSAFSPGSTVRGNTATANNKDGFLVSTGSNVAVNTASQNGGSGIRGYLGAVGVLAQENTSTFNNTGLFGVLFRGNVVDSNLSLATSGTNSGRNICLGVGVTDVFCSGSASSSPEILALCPGGPNC